jgi:hypothetical protein
MQHSKKDIDLAKLYTQFNGINTGKNQIRSISVGHKTVNNVQTDIESIVFCVKEKKSTKDLQPSKIIPKTVVIDGKEYKTDVVQHSKPNYALSSYGCYGTNMDAYASTHRQKFRWYPPTLVTPASGQPLKGGISIGQSDGGTGTLGSIVIDTVNNKLCGLSNAHVFVKDPFLASEKSILAEYGYTTKVFNIKDKKVTQPGSADGRVGSTANRDTAVGYVKRYYPFYYWNWNNDGEFVKFNYVDAAICSLQKKTEEVSTIGSGDISITPGKQPFVVWKESTTQHNMTFGGFVPTEYPFATSGEIDSVGIGTRVWKSGRTTGFVGKDECELEIIGTNATVAVGGYTFSQFQVEVTFSDCLKFAYKKVNDEPVPRPAAIIGGDSGSVLIADFEGTKKIIGLNFAGGWYSEKSGPGSAGYACRIDHVANLLNLTSTSTLNMFDENDLDNPYYDNYYDNPLIWKFKVENGLSPLKTKLWDQVYHQCGLYN